MGNSFNNIGVTYWSIGNYKDALINFFQALEHYEKSGQEGSRANVMNNIGLIYADLENYETALDYYRLSLSVYQNLGDSIKMGAAITNKGTALLNLNHIDSAMHYLYKSMEIKELTNDLYGQSISLEGIGNAWLKQQNYDKAIYYFERGKNITQQIGFHYGKASALLGIANASLEQDNTGSALEYAEEALQIAQQTTNVKMQYKAHNIISRTYDNTGNYKESLEHYRSYNELKNEAINKNRLHQVYNLEMQHAAEKNLKEIERQEMLLSRKNTMLVFTSVGFLAILTIIFLLYRLHINKLRQKQRSKLAEANLKLTEERTRSALEAEIAERKRLGFELHDGVGPLLSLAKLNVSALIKKDQLSQERKSIILKNTEKTINEVLREMKQISNNMAPLMLLEKGFEEAIRDLAYKLDQSSSYKVSLEIIGLNGRMEPYIEHALFRSMQELLNNVLRHAKGTEINIQVIKTTEDLTIMVEDNGKGFESNLIQKKKGIGLKSAVSRIEGLNGDFFIDSVKDRGTIVSIIIPLAQPKEN